MWWPGTSVGTGGPPYYRLRAAVGLSWERWDYRVTVVGAALDRPGTCGTALGPLGPLGPLWYLWECFHNGFSTGRWGGGGVEYGAAPSPQASQQDCSEPGHPRASQQDCSARGGEGNHDYRATTTHPFNTHPISFTCTASAGVLQHGWLLQGMRLQCFSSRAQARFITVYKAHM